MPTNVNYDNINALLTGIVTNLKSKINTMDLTADQKIKIPLIYKTGLGNNLLSDDGTYKNIPLDQLQTMSDKLTTIYNTLGIKTSSDRCDGIGIATMPTARSGLTSVLYNGKVYCIGGNNAYNTLGTVEIYDIVNNTWSTGTPIPTARMALTSVLYNNKIYCIGGYNDNGSLNTVEIYDIVNNTWSTGKPMPTARYALTSQVYNGKIYCIGGGSNVTFNIVEIYDIVNDTWITGTPMPTARTYLTSQVYNSKIYSIGGQDKNGTILNTVEVYYFATMIYSIITPQSILNKLAIIITTGTGTKLLTDNGTYQEYIPNGYIGMSTDEMNTIISGIKTTL